jgi:hypothetical protein
MENISLSDNIGVRISPKGTNNIEIRPRKGRASHGGNSFDTYNEF